MGKKQPKGTGELRVIIRLFLRLPWPLRVAVILLLLVVGVVAILLPSGNPSAPVAGPGEYLFCFWNVENLFDDAAGENYRDPDKLYDDWFHKNPSILRKKLDHLSAALVTMNAGRGPDILALVEVESERAAELLKNAMNERLKDRPELHYTTTLMKEVRVGRHIAPALITRLPAKANRPSQWDNVRRLLEAHITVAGHDLVLVSSHWTSRVSDETGEQRDKYAKPIYERYQELYQTNPNVDFLVCGDFNDTPEDASVKNTLHAVGDADAVRRAGGKLLFNLLAGRSPEEFGTHKYGSKWFVFDQIVVSAGMLDQKGWSCDPQSLTVIREGLSDKKGGPWPFGAPHGGDRPNEPEVSGPEPGYSDHFPVVVRLTVHGVAP